MCFLVRVKVRDTSEQADSSQHTTQTHVHLSETLFTSVVCPDPISFLEGFPEPDSFRGAQLMNNLINNNQHSALNNGVSFITVSGSDVSHRVGQILTDISIQAQL